MAVSVNMPDGSVLVVDPEDVIWIREALKEEFKGTIAVRLGDGLIYSVDPLDRLLKIFSVPGETKLVQFTPPVRPDKIWVDAMKVKQVTPSNDLHSPQANAVLKFSVKMFLAVRETVEQANGILSGPSVIIA